MELFPPQIVLRTSLTISLAIPIALPLLPGFYIAGRMKNWPLAIAVYLVLFALLFCLTYYRVIVDEKGIRREFTLYTFLNRSILKKDFANLYLTPTRFGYGLHFTSIDGNKIVIAPCEKFEIEIVENILKKKAELI